MTSAGHRMTNKLKWYSTEKDLNKTLSDVDNWSGVIVTCDFKRITEV